MDTVPTPPESTKTSLRQRLRARANQRWPQLADLTIRHHGGFAYVNGQVADGTTLPLFRLRYGGSANSWGFAIHLASRNGYQDTVLPSGYPVGTPEEALDCACGLYLADPSAWLPPQTDTPSNLRARALAGRIRSVAGLRAVDGRGEDPRGRAATIDTKDRRQSPSVPAQAPSAITAFDETVAGQPSQASQHSIEVHPRVDRDRRRPSAAARRQRVEDAGAVGIEVVA